MASLAHRFPARRRQGGAPWACLIALLILPWAMGQPAWAQTSALGRSAYASDNQVKAAYLHKFLNYVEWPAAAAADGPYLIGVVGSEEIAGELAKIAGKNPVNQRPVAVRKPQGPGDLKGLHILYAGGDKARQAQWVQWASGQAILVVTDTEGPPPGSMVNFRLFEERVRFEVFLAPAEEAGIRINSRMLSVALSVTKE